MHIASSSFLIRVCIIYYFVLKLFVCFVFRRFSQQSNETSKTEKISYYYQAIYIVGCTLTLIYAAALRLWPVYIPITLELTLIISLTVMKVIFDRREKKEKQELLKNNEEKDIDEEHGVIRKDSDGEDDNSSKD